MSYTHSRDYHRCNETISEALALYDIEATLSSKAFVWDTEWFKGYEAGLRDAAYMLPNPIPGTQVQAANLATGQQLWTSSFQPSTIPVVPHGAAPCFPLQTLQPAICIGLFQQGLVNPQELERTCAHAPCYALPFPQPTEYTGADFSTLNTAEKSAGDHGAVQASFPQGATTVAQGAPPDRSSQFCPCPPLVVNSLGPNCMG